MRAWPWELVTDTKGKKKQTLRQIPIEREAAEASFVQTTKVIT